MTIQELLGDRREEILRLASRHGAYDVRVIGSAARGEAGPQSDLDLLVRWSDSASLLDHAAPMLQLEACLGRKSILPVTAGSNRLSANRSTAMRSLCERRLPASG